MGRYKKREIKTGFADSWKGYVPGGSCFVKILRRYFEAAIIDITIPETKETVEYPFYYSYGRYYWQKFQSDDLRNIYRKNSSNRKSKSGYISEGI